ncbi:hypothetical protein D3C77_309250 [compost metagenome]
MAIWTDRDLARYTCIVVAVVNVQVDKLLRGTESVVRVDTGLSVSKHVKNMPRARSFGRLRPDVAYTRSTISVTHCAKRSAGSRSLSSGASKVEYPFRVIKYLFGSTQVRLHGLAKNTCRWPLDFFCRIGGLLADTYSECKEVAGYGCFKVLAAAEGTTKWGNGHECCKVKAHRK